MIERYLLRTILPYFLLAWILLTVILFLQQGSRFTEILLSANIPARLIFELSAALIVSVIAFTSPMALLTGIVVGLGQLRGDSELIALQAAGVSPRRIVLPCLLLGILVSVIAFFINLQGVPIAAGIARRVAVEAALVKLESPIEPGLFNTEFSNYVIYVKDGNNEQGVWERVFIYLPEKNGNIKLITARLGRIDASNEKSELVLSDAVVTTMASNLQPQPVTLERVNSLRVALDTGRKKLREKLEGVERIPDEMGLAELGNYALQKSGKQKAEAQILWHRRLALSFAPFFLSILGAAVCLRTGRGGRAWGSVIALVTLVVYYLLSLFGEQTVRSGILPAYIGSWLSTSLIFALALWWLFITSRRAENRLKLPEISSYLRKTKFGKAPLQSLSRFSFGRFSTGFYGLCERDLLQNLLWYFSLITLALLILFHVFTVFEVLRSLTATAGGGVLVLRYLLFLSPLVLWQITPTALMIAILITYTVKVRQNETIIWGAAGQSIYVLLFPCILTAVLLGIVSWEWQERVLPITNPRQDILRMQLRGAGSVGNQEGRFWVASANGIYSFVANRGSDNVQAKDVTFYQFSEDRTHLARVLHTATATWRDGVIDLSGNGREIVWLKSYIETRDLNETKTQISEGENPFGQVFTKTSHLSSEDLKKVIQATESPAEERRLSVALQRRYSSLFLPLVLVIFSAPLALSLRRQASIGRSLGMALGIWLLFTLAISLFERLGNEGILPPSVAVWSPLILFSSLGCYLLAKTRN